MTDLSKLSDEELLAMHDAATQPQPAAPSGGMDLSKLSDADLIAMHAQATSPNPPPPEKADVLGKLDATMRGAAQGATLGFADEGAAAIGGFKDWLAAKGGLRGDISLADAYHTWRDNIRKADDSAHKAHPGYFTGGQVGGSVATAFAPGLGALNAGKGAGLIEMGAKGAMQGAIAGAGDANNLSDIPGEALSGGITGAKVGTALGALGKVGGAVMDAVKPAKAASVLLNAPESAIQRYIDSPQTVRNARPRAEIVQDFLNRAEQLKQEVIGGSEKSRDILSKEGQKMSGSEIADIFDNKADQIQKRSEGVMDDPQIASAYNWLRDQAKKYRPTIPADVTADLQHSLHGDLVSQGVHPDVAADLVGSMPQEADRQLSTNRVKDLVQSLDKRTQFETAPGQFADVDDMVRKGVRGDVDAALKARSPAYEEQMKGVAADSGILNGVNDLAQSPQGLDNLLKRTQRGNTPHLMESLNQFDQRTGGGLVNELQDSAVKDALDKGAMNGSRNVNLHGGIGETVGEAIGGLPGKIVGKAVGLLGGATIDKYGPAMARGSVDMASKLQGMLSSSEGMQRLGKFGGILSDAAKRGNSALAVTHYMLSQQHPEYQQMMNQSQNQ